MSIDPLHLCLAFGGCQTWLTTIGDTYIRVSRQSRRRGRGEVDPNRGLIPSYRLGDHFTNRDNVYEYCSWIMSYRDVPASVHPWHTSVPTYPTHEDLF